MSSEGDLIRDALDFKPHWHRQAEKKAAGLEALAALEARLAELTGRNQFLSTEQVRADIAEARLAEAERRSRILAWNLALFTFQGQDVSLSEQSEIEYRAALSSERTQ